ncbi:MAG: MogA/MoaB family molybdenum cofactor biosynthesis protein [bacterium]|nr:MogA/MoaB family molybdenum cofactor biosynthesis protein [bacterium]
MPAEHHRDQIIKCVDCAVITVSDTRTVDTDKSGPLLCEALGDAGHQVCAYGIVKDDFAALTDRLMALCETGSVQAILLSGGTGFSPRDTTYEAVVGVLDRRIDGFGELFRVLSYAEIGPGAMLSRAVAGVARGTLIFAMPGSTGGTRLAVEKLILPELGHLAWLLRQS